jgi:hypothetical protein
MRYVLENMESLAAFKECLKVSKCFSEIFFGA